MSQERTGARRLLDAAAAFILGAMSVNLSAAGASAQSLGGGDRPVGPDYARSPVYAANGVAATAQPLASRIAVDILKQGGSAVDAAIAANAALGLMEPTGNGIGGDLFAIVWDPETQQLYGLNASGRAPQGRSYAQMKKKLGVRKHIPTHGSLTVTVPGAVDGWFALHERFGKLAMVDNLAPAISYAREGFPVSPVIADLWAMNFARFARMRDLIEEFDNAKATYLINGVRIPQTGEIFANPDLARTYELIAEGGRDAFYKGEIARAMDRYMKSIGGDLRYGDLAAHESEWQAPRSVNYRGYDVYELPPNSQGFAALQMLNILKNIDLAQYDRGGPEVFHYITEAKRLAFEDVAKFYADPDFAPAPLEWLLSDEYGRERFALIDPARALAEVAPGEPKLEGPGDTTYLTVADKDGMMVSLIQSNYMGMGSGLVPTGLGFMLQNRGALFSMEAGHANVYAPGKRPFHTIIPAFVMKEGKPVMSFGLMGGSMQPQGHVQVLVNIIDFGMNLQAAGDAARLRHDGGRSPTSKPGSALGVLNLESGVAAETVAALIEMGHDARVVSDGGYGGYQAIWRDPDAGVYRGATEMRKDGQVSGY